jgi:hypothetical protein
MADGHPQLLADVWSNWSYLVRFDLCFLLVEKQFQACSKNGSSVDTGFYILWGIAHCLSAICQVSE